MGKKDNNEVTTTQEPDSRAQELMDTFLSEGTGNDKKDSDDKKD